MKPTKPCIILIPGAFHTEWVMYPLAAQLKRQGYETRCLGLSTVDGPGRTVDDDVKYILERLLEPLVVKEEQDIILYLHSYAGFPGSAAIKDLSKQERLANGKDGGVIGLMYQSAFVPEKGKTLLEMVGGHPPWQNPRVRSRTNEVKGAGVLADVLPGRYRAYRSCRPKADLLRRRQGAFGNRSIGQSMQSISCVLQILRKRFSFRRRFLSSTPCLYPHDQRSGIASFRSGSLRGQQWT